MRQIVGLIHRLCIGKGLPVVKGKERDSSASTLPVRVVSSLHLKGELDASGLDIDGNWSSGEGNGDIRLSLSWNPDVIEVIINGHMFIVQRGPQIERIELINLLFKKISNSLHTHNVVQQSGKLNLIDIQSGGRVDSSDGKHISTAPGNIFIVKQLIAEELPLFDDHSLLGKDDLITEGEGSASSVDGEYVRLLDPLKGDIDFKLSSLDNDGIIPKDICLLFGIPIVEGRFSIEDNIRGGFVVLEGNVIQLWDLLLDSGEGSVEFVLLADGVLTDKIEVGGVALEGERGVSADEEKDGEC